jgi:hypothetical protein
MHGVCSSATDSSTICSGAGNWWSGKTGLLSSPLMSRPRSALLPLPLLLQGQQQMARTVDMVLMLTDRPGGTTGGPVAALSTFLLP